MPLGAADEKRNGAKKAGSWVGWLMAWGELFGCLTKYPAALSIVNVNRWQEAIRHSKSYHAEIKATAGPDLISAQNLTS